MHNLDDLVKRLGSPKMKPAFVPLCPESSLRLYFMEIHVPFSFPWDRQKEVFPNFSRSRSLTLRPSCHDNWQLAKELPQLAFDFLKVKIGAQRNYEKDRKTGARQKHFSTRTVKGRGGMKRESWLISLLHSVSYPLISRRYVQQRGGKGQ